jgi:hypothetical protein
MIIKNDAQLKKILMDKCKKAVANAEEKVYMEFANTVDEFYSEFDPEEYIRTSALRNSLRHTGVKQVGNQYVSKVTAEVGFDTPRYEHGLVPIQSGGFGYSYWDDEKIQDVVMTSDYPHGGAAKGTAIWINGMKKLGGENGIENLLKQELIEQGLKIK